MSAINKDSLAQAILNGTVMGAVEHFGPLSIVPVENMKNKSLVTATVAGVSSLATSVTGWDGMLASSLSPSLGDMSTSILGYRAISDGAIFAALEALRNPANRSAKRALYNFILNTGASSVTSMALPNFSGSMSTASNRRKVPDGPLQVGPLQSNPALLSSPGF